MIQRQYVRLDEDLLHGPESTVPAATLRAHAVRTELRPCVASILSYREVFAQGQGVTERVMADGAVRIVVHLDQETARPGPMAQAAATAPTAPTAMILGPSATSALVSLRGHVHGLAITLKPGAAQALLGVTARELAGAAVPVDALWPGDGARLLTRLAEQPTEAARIAVLQTELARRSRGLAPAVHPGAAQALRLLIDSAGQFAVRELAAAVGMGERRLQQLFSAQIGLSPRTWRRLARLQGCLRALRGQPDPDWSDVATAGGFYDQAHLIHEFQAICGCTPTEFRRHAISGSSKTTP